MKTLGYLIQKEFIQIFRNKALLPMMTILPIVQLIVLSNAASQEVKDVRIAIVDKDQSELSREIRQKIATNKQFIYEDTPSSNKEAMELMQNNVVDIILEIPGDFEKELINGQSPKIQMLVNSINGQQATVGSGYLSNIISGANKAYINENPLLFKGAENGELISISSRNWYNSRLEYTHFMAPGILAELTALLTIILSAMNIVRERELGTIEQINVTPIKKWQFILGKLIPFLCIGLLLFSLGLVASKLIFNISLEGSLVWIFAYAIVNIICVLGLGLLISNFANTQQQAIFIAFFFVMIFILMCGLFTPIDSMPKWAQYLTIPNPLAHFISVSRKVLIKGGGLKDIQWEFAYTIVLAIILNTWAILSYKKQQ